MLDLRGTRADLGASRLNFKGRVTGRYSPDRGGEEGQGAQRELGSSVLCCAAGGLLK